MDTIKAGQVRQEQTFMETLQDPISWYFKSKLFTANLHCIDLNELWDPTLGPVWMTHSIPEAFVHSTIDYTQE